MADDRELLEDARLEEEARLASEEFELLLAEDEALARSAGQECPVIPGTILRTRTERGQV